VGQARVPSCRRRHDNANPHTATPKSSELAWRNANQHSLAEVANLQHAMTRRDVRDASVRMITSQHVVNRADDAPWAGIVQGSSRSMCAVQSNRGGESVCVMSVDVRPIINTSGTQQALGCDVRAREECMAK
jgi:hypothetical protein